jgi:hypothetical protein
VRGSPPCIKGIDLTKMNAAKKNFIFVGKSNMSSLQENVSPSNEQATTLDDDLKRIRDAKYDLNLENNVCNWIGLIIGKMRPAHEPAASWLKSGDILCTLMNNIRPGTIKKYNAGTTSKFKQMENITLFLRACREVGMLEKDLFSTVDLFEAKDMNAVILSLFNLGGTIQSTIPYFNGPKLGIKQTNGKFQIVPPLVVPEQPKLVNQNSKPPVVDLISDIKPVFIEQSAINPTPLPQLPDEVPYTSVESPVSHEKIAPVLKPGTGKLEKSEVKLPFDVTISRPAEVSQIAAPVLPLPVRSTNPEKERSPLATVASVSSIPVGRLPLSPKESIGKRAPNTESPAAVRDSREPGQLISNRETISSTTSRPPIPQSPVANRGNVPAPPIQSQQELDIKPRRRTPLNSKQIINATKMASQGALPALGNSLSNLPQTSGSASHLPPAPVLISGNGSGQQAQQAPLIYAPQMVMPSRPIHPAAMGQYQSYGSNLLRQVSSASMQPPGGTFIMQSPRQVVRRHVMPADESYEMMERAAIEWIEAVLGEAKPLSFTVHHWLRTGEVLCRLANMLLSASPNPHIRIHSIARVTDNIQQQRENSRRFVDICRALGVSDADLFTPSDLFEGQNMKKVITCVYCLGGILQNYEWWVKSPFALLGRRLRIQSLNKV